MSRSTQTFLLIAAMIAPMLVGAADELAPVGDRINQVILDRQAATADAVTRLTRALEDPEAEVRYLATRSLAELGALSQPAMPALRLRLDDTDPAVVIRAADALEALGVPAEELQEARQRAMPLAPRVIDQFSAARALIGIVPAAELAPIFVKQGVRLARQLDESGDIDRYQPRLVPVERAIRRLARTGDRDAIEPFRRAIGLSEYLTPTLLRALDSYRPTPDDFLTLLISQLNRSTFVAVPALELIAQRTRNERVIGRWVPEVAARCRSGLAAYRAQVARTLGAGGPAAVEGMDCLVTLLDDDEATVRAESVTAIAALAAVTDEVTPTALRVTRITAASLRRHALEDADESVRAAARDAYVALPIAPEFRARLIVEAAGGVEAAAALLEARGLADVDHDLAPDPAERLRRLGYAESALGLRTALGAQSATAVEAFLDAGFGVNDRFDSGWRETPLVLAVSGGACVGDPAGVEATVDLLLGRGADVNLFDDRGNSPLTAAARRCSPELIRALLAAGADMKHQNGRGMDPFMVAIQDPSPAAEVLIEAGYRLPDAFIEAYRDAVADDPERLALIERASR